MKGSEGSIFIIVYLSCFWVCLWIPVNRCFTVLQKTEDGKEITGYSISKSKTLLMPLKKVGAWFYIFSDFQLLLLYLSNAPQH